MSTNNSIEQALSMFNQIQKNDEKKGTSTYVDNAERLKNYFSTNIPKGETSTTKYFRMMAMPNGRPFETIHFHNVQVGDNWQKIFDPEQEGNEFYDGEISASPLNELRKELYSTGKEDDKKEAKKYFNRRYYIIKGVEVDENGVIIDGRPKFWRFPHNTKKDGVMDKIISIVNRERKTSETPIWDLENGVTLEIEVQKTENPSNKGNYYSKVTTIFPGKRGLVTTDQDLLMKLKNDENSWTDVYSVKSEGFLRIIADGDTPVYSKEKKDFVAKSSLDSTESASMDDADEYTESNNSTTKTTTTESAGNSVPPKPQPVDAEIEGNDIDEDDLPF